MNDNILTDILNVWMLHNELVHGNRGNPKEGSRNNHGDNSWDPSQNAAQVRLLVLQMSYLSEGRTYESDHD